MTALEKFGVRYIRYLPREDDPSSPLGKQYHFKSFDQLVMTDIFMCKGRGWKSTYLTESKSKFLIAEDTLDACLYQ
jgi:hypothetical protein